MHATIGYLERACGFGKTKYMQRLENLNKLLDVFDLVLIWLSVLLYEFRKMFSTVRDIFYIVYYIY